MVAGGATTCSPALRMRPRRGSVRLTPTLRPRKAAEADPPLWIRPVPEPEPMGTAGTGNGRGRGSGVGAGENGSCDGSDDDAETLIVERV